MARSGYSRGQIGLHWLVVALLVPQYILHDAVKQAFRAMLNGEAVTPSALLGLHIYGGIAILVLMLWRLGLRARRGAPLPPAAGSPALELLAKAVHGLLYLVLILLPLTGLVAWFGEARLAGELHELLKVPMLGLIGLHVVAALYHQFVLRDGLMRRMARSR